MPPCSAHSIVRHREDRLFQPPWHPTPPPVDPRSVVHPVALGGGPRALGPGRGRTTCPLVAWFAPPAWRRRHGSVQNVRYGLIPNAATRVKVEKAAIRRW